MASLTETAYYSRQVIKWGGIAILVMMVGRVIFGGMIAYWQAAHPPPLPPPTMGFGSLPELTFPKAAPLTLTYELQLPTGIFPDYPDRSRVYFMPTSRPNLLALEESKKEAKALGFVTEPIQISEVQFRWAKTTPLTTTLDMMIYTGLFTYRVDWFSQTDFLAEKQLVNEFEAVNQVRNFLQRSKFWMDDLDASQPRVAYLKAGAGTYRETVSLSEADFVQVDIFRQKLEDNYPVYTPDPNKGLIRGIVTHNQAVPIVYLEYNYYPVDYQTFHTYPIKTAVQAFDELKQGKGYVARLIGKVTAVTVRKVELAYFDTTDTANYLQPIYVFSGDDEFLGYVPAVRANLNK